MPTLRTQGISVETDAEGFLLNGGQWTPEIAEVLAREAGVPRLTDRHWRLIALYREEAARRGESPGPVRITELSGLGEEEIAALFPGSPSLSIARIAGLPRPRTQRATGVEPQENEP